MLRSMDDIALWPDGTWSTSDDVARGHFAFMSDDYEIISILDTDRPTAAGLDGLLEIG